MSNDYEELSDEELLSKLEEIEQRKQKLSEVNSTVEGVANSLNTEEHEIEQEYRRKMRELHARRQQLIAKNDAIFRKARELENEKTRAEEILKRREEERRREEELAKARAATELLSQKWERLIMGAPWREWARDYQIAGAKQFAQEKTMILADAMGLGKTLTSIIALDFIRAATEDASPENPYEPEIIGSEYDYEQNRTVEKWGKGATKPCGIKALYIAPNGLQDNIWEEIQRWANYRTVLPLANLPKETRKFSLEVAKENLTEYVVVVNFEAWSRDKALIEALSKMEFDTIIIDEAHNIKETSTSAYRGVKDIVVGTQAPFVLPMTGTPILNKPVDLYPLLNLIMPERFYNKNVYLQRYCEQRWVDDGFGEDGRSKRRMIWTFRPGGAESIGHLLGKRYLRRTKETANLNLPPLSVEEHKIQIDAEAYPDQARARKTMRENAAVLLSSLDDDGNKRAVTAASKLAVYTRLRQIETWPAGIPLKDPFDNIIGHLDVEESQKLDYILNDEGEGLLKDIVESGERVVLFSQFIHPMKVLQERAMRHGIQSALIIGETPKDERKRINHDFDIKHRDEEGHGKYDAVFCHYKTGGTGLNFTEASQMIIIDEEWNPAKRDQAYGRIERIGQEKPMTVHRVQMKKTIDDWMSKIMSDKEDLVAGFEEAMPSAEDFLDALDQGLI